MAIAKRFRSPQKHKTVKGNEIVIGIFQETTSEMR